MKKVNILYVEKQGFEDTALDEYKEYIASIFLSLGYKAVIETYCLKPAKNKLDSIIEEKSIDVIFCDLTLGTNMGENALGLGFVKFFKTKYPEILTCGISGKDVAYRDTTNPKNLPSFDLFIDKGRHDEERYKEYIVNEMRNLFCSNTEIEIKKQDLPKEEEEFIDLPFFKRLLKLITFTTHESSTGTHVKTITLSPTSGGYSPSHVFKMCCHTANGEKVINSILKCSKKKESIQEMKNYLNYVKWYLPYTWRPEVLSSAFGYEYGMICYSFAYNGEKTFSSITDRIMNAEYGEVDKAIEKIFSLKSQKWYSEEKWEPVTRPIHRYYNSVYFPDGNDMPRKKPYEQVKKFIREELGGHIDNDEYHILGSSFPTAHKLFTEAVTRSYRKCICHGDLNTNNILTSDENDELIFIDFQETHEGHVFHDFIVFEMCFRVYQETKLSFDELLNIEIEIAKNNFDSIEHMNEMWKRIKRVRELAVANFPNEDFKTYYCGMAMHAFRLFRSIERLENWQLEAVLAVLLANLKMLFSTEDGERE